MRLQPAHHTEQARPDSGQLQRCMGTLFQPGQQLGLLGLGGAHQFGKACSVDSLADQGQSVWQGVEPRFVGDSVAAQHGTANIPLCQTIAPTAQTQAFSPGACLYKSGTQLWCGRALQSQTQGKAASAFALQVYQFRQQRPLVPQFLGLRPQIGRASPRHAQPPFAACWQARQSGLFLASSPQCSSYAVWNHALRRFVQNPHWPQTVQ